MQSLHTEFSFAPPRYQYDDYKNWDEDSVGLKLDQLWRIDTNMSGTLLMLVLLLAYYKQQEFSIDQLFSKAFSSEQANQKEMIEAFNQMDDLIN